MILLTSFFLLLISTTPGLTQKQFAHISPGSSNFLCVAPISPSSASEIKTYIDLKTGFTYRWKNLPNWAVANGGSFSGVPPLGLKGKVPVTVEYEDGKGSQGSYTFVLDYDSNRQQSSSVDGVWNGAGMLNVVEGVTADRWTGISSSNSQMIVLPELNTNNLQITKTVPTIFSNPLTNGLSCNIIASNLNFANTQLLSSLTNFTTINNQLSASNTTIITLQLNQTQLRNQLNNIQTTLCSKSHDTTTILQTIKTYESRISSTQNQINTLTKRINSDQAKLFELESKKVSFLQQQEENKLLVETAERDVSSIRSQLQSIDVMISTTKSSLNQISVQYQSLSTNSNQLNIYLSTSNTRINCAQTQLATAQSQLTLLTSNRTQLLSSISQLNATIIILKTKLNQLLDSETTLKWQLQQANSIVKSILSNKDLEAERKRVDVDIREVQRTIASDFVQVKTWERRLGLYQEELIQLTTSVKKQGEVMKREDEKLRGYQRDLSLLNENIQIAQINYDTILALKNSLSNKINQNKDDIRKFTRELKICEIDAKSSNQPWTNQCNCPCSSSSKSSYLKSCDKQSNCKSPCTIQVPDSLQSLRDKIDKKAFFDGDKFFA